MYDNKRSLCSHGITGSRFHTQTSVLIYICKEDGRTLSLMKTSKNAKN